MQVKKVSDFTQGRVHNLELVLDRLNEKARSSEIRATEKDSLEEVIRYSLPPPSSHPCPPTHDLATWSARGPRCCMLRSAQPHMYWSHGVEDFD